MSTTEVPLADVLAEPAMRAFPLGWDRKPKRRIEYRWTVREDAGDTIVLELSCSHWGAPQKAYVAYVSNSRVTPDGVTCTSLEFRRLAALSCARYSKADFEAFARRALRQLRATASNEFADFLAGEHVPGAR